MHNEECCAGQKWRVHAHTHANASCAWFDHSHTRPKACRAPFGWGLTRQAKRRASHLGHTRELLAREHAHIGGRRQADILIRQFLNDVHARRRHFYAGTTPGFPRRGLASEPNVLFAQRLQTGPVPLRQSGSVLDLVIAHTDVFTLREATRQSGASISAAFDGCGWIPGGGG